MGQVSRLIKPGDITKELYKKATQFHRTFHGLKITNSYNDIIKVLNTSYYKIHMYTLEVVISNQTDLKAGGRVVE